MASERHTQDRAFCGQGEEPEKAACGTMNEQPACGPGNEQPACSTMNEHPASVSGKNKRVCGTGNKKETGQGGKKKQTELLAEAKDVTFFYPDQPDRPVLKDLNLKIYRGECLAVLGESGAGKTTLLKLLCGLLRPSGGQIYYEGEPLREPRSDIALIFQNYGLFPWKSVRDNILLPVRIRGERSVDEKEVERLLDYLGLGGLSDRFPAELSGGQLQRTALGRAVMSRASLLLMDEPFSALDLRNRARLQTFMKTFLEDTGMTSVIVTHSIGEALYMGDRVAVFDPETGRISRVWDGCRREKDRLPSEQDDSYRQIRESLLQMQES